MSTHRIPVRIYYEDTDAGGIVYHANYLKYAERGRSEFLRHIHYTNAEFVKESGCIFVVRRIEIDYLAPAYLDDYLQVATKVKALKNSSLELSQTIYKGDDVLADLKVIIVCVDAKSKRPRRLPEKARKALKTVASETAT